MLTIEHSMKPYGCSLGVFLTLPAGRVFSGRLRVRRSTIQGRNWRRFAAFISLVLLFPQSFDFFLDLPPPPKKVVRWDSTEIERGHYCFVVEKRWLQQWLVQSATDMSVSSL
jgi:hypothetical protein